VREAMGDPAVPKEVCGTAGQAAGLVGSLPRKKVRLSSVTQKKATNSSGRINLSKLGLLGVASGVGGKKLALSNGDGGAKCCPCGLGELVGLSVLRRRGENCTNF
jgi:hypothetical protein